MPTTLEKTVREIAVENPATIRIFESLGIDYCCGGRLSLSEACSRANADLTRVTELLEAAGRGDETAGSVDWNRKPLAEVIAHIVNTHHAFVRNAIPRIQPLAARVVAKHGPNHPELPQIESLFEALAHELLSHLMKEEQILFPYIANMERASATGGGVPASCFGTVTRPIANMVAEHEDAGAILAQIRELSNGFAAPSGACPSYLNLYMSLEEFEADLHQHIHIENNILFPRAVAMESANA